MGYYGFSLDNHSLMLGNWSFDFLEDQHGEIKPKKKEWFEKQTLELYWKDDLKKYEEPISFPLMRFCKLVKLKTNYTLRFDYQENDLLQELFFEEIAKRNVVLKGHILLIKYEEERTNRFYLISEFLSDEVLLSNNKEKSVIIELKTSKEYNWIRNNGLTFKSID